MELALLIWFIETVTKFAGFLQFMFGVAFLIILVPTLVGIAMAFDGIENGKQLTKAFKPYLIAVGIGFVITGLVPSKDTGYTMLAAYGVQTVAENEHVQEFMGDGLAILQLKMKEYKLELEE